MSHTPPVDSKGAAIDEIKAVIGGMPNYIFEYLELSDDIKKEWKYGSKASDFGGHNQFMQKYTDAILAILAQEVNSRILEVLGRVNDKAMACARQKGTGFEELARVYDKAVMKELADLTQ